MTGGALRGLATALMGAGCLFACAPATTTGRRPPAGRVEETVGERRDPDVARDATAAGSPLSDARGVHGTIDPATGQRTAAPAVEQRIREPRRLDLQAGRVRQAGEEYQPESGELPYGYRVQVVAAPDFPTASQEATRLKDQLGGVLPVYIEFFDPYYKVRVGDFATQEEAQPAVTQVRDLGYRDAWAVRTTIKRVTP